MDKATVSCNGGISALSAFFNGYGSALAISVPLEISVTFSEKPEKNDNSLVKSTFDILRERFEVKEHFSIWFKSSIPAARGLKSSSALTLSLAAAFMKLNSITMGEDEFLRMCAEISIENGSSSTGAFDDLAACYYGGVCLTDNTENKLIFRKSLRKDPVVIAYGGKKRASGRVDLAEMEKYSRHADVIHSLIRERRYYEAMVMNGNLLGVIYGQSSELIKHFLESGASYAGQCGKGPAVFGIFSSENEAHEAYESSRSIKGISARKTSFSNRGMRVR